MSNIEKIEAYKYKGILYSTKAEALRREERAIRLEEEENFQEFIESLYGTKISYVLDSIHMGENECKYRLSGVLTRLILDNKDKVIDMLSRADNE